MNKSRPLNFIKKHKVWSALTVILLVLVLAYWLPFLAGDGTDKFTGVEKEIATQALKSAYNNLDPMHRIDIPPIVYYVEDVRKMSQEQVSQYCQYESKRSPNTDFYNVDISIVTYFGVRTDRSTNQNGCIFIK